MFPGELFPLLWLDRDPHTFENSRRCAGPAESGDQTYKPVSTVAVGATESGAVA